MHYPIHDLNDLVSAVEDKKFIPFIGLGASTRRKDNPAECLKIAQRIQELKSENSVSPEDARYLDSMAAAQGISDFLEEVQLSEDADENEDQSNFQSEQEKQLSLQLTRLGSALIGLFGDLMNQSRNFVANLYDYRVPLPYGSEAGNDEMQRICDILNYTLSAARVLVLNGIEGQRRPGTELMAESIYRELIILAFRLAERLIRKDHTKSGILKTHEDRINSLRGTATMVQQDCIRLDEIAWLNDMLWFTLRHDIPMYLDASELTFRLSLDPRIEELRHSELPQVAEHQRMTKKLPSYNQAIKALTDALVFIAKNHRNIPEFHRVMAATLWYQFEEYQKREREFSAPDSTDIEKQDAINFSMLPMVITTNYDRLIEAAFRCLHKNYEVVYPVWKFLPNTDNPMESPDWYNRTYSYTGTDYEASEPKDCSRTARADLKLEGPIIVKLHGSPLEPLPKSDRFRMQHAITLTESDYLSTIVQGSHSPAVYPTWIEEFLAEKNNSVWWLMGYSSDDWFVHLRIYKYLSYLDLSSRNAKALAETFDPVRSAFLDTQQVRKVQLDLDLVADTLRLKVKRIGEILEESEKEADL